jgi:hypothetical protein
MMTHSAGASVNYPPGPHSPLVVGLAVKRVRALAWRVSRNTKPTAWQVFYQ